MSVYANFNDENFSDTLTNDIVSFHQLALLSCFIHGVLKMIPGIVFRRGITFRLGVKFRHIMQSVA